MADEYILDKSMSPNEPIRFDVLKRELRTVIDSNNGNYAGPEIIFDSGLQAIANSNQFIDYANSSLVMPVHLSWQTFSGDATASSSDTMLCNLKNHFAMVHSLRVTLANQELVSYSVPFRNLAMTFDVVSQLTAEQERHAMQLGIQYEDANCFSYHQTASPYGLGVCNTNVGQYPITADCTIDNINKVHYNEKRLAKLHAFNKNAIQANSVDGRAFPLISREALIQSQDSYVADWNTATCSMWVIVKIPLTFMCDLFKQCPLVKNGMWTLSVMHNANSQVTISTGGSDFANPVTEATFNDITVTGLSPTTPNGFLPMQVGSMIYGSGIGTDMFGSGTPGSLTVQCRIGSVSGGPFTALVPSGFSTAPPIPNCRLLLSMVTLSPEAESRYLANPVKHLVFQDMVYKHITASNGEYFDNLVYNNVSRLRKLVMLPYHTRPTGTITPQNDCLSPFSSFGASYLSSPYARLSEFQVLISGQPMYPRALNTIEEFYGEFRNTCLVNGGSYGAEYNGLISQQDWSLQYGAYVVDLSRKSASIDSLTQTISLQFKNNTKYPMGIHCFLFYEKELYLNVETGQLQAK
jgi:hypothetical protein